jgi:hypothetical protein
MKNKYRKLNLMVSLLTAVLMLATAYFMDNKENKDLVQFMLMTLWLIPFLHFNKKQKKCC